MVIVTVVAVLIVSFHTCLGQPSSACEVGTSRYEAHANCDRFWHCDNGVWLERYCVVGTQWSVTREICDLASNVNCVQGATTTQLGVSLTPPTTSNLPPGVCDGPDSKFAPQHPDCSAFTRVVDGQVREYRCAWGLVFNANTNVCDWPSSYPECGAPGPNPTLTPLSDPTQTCPTQDAVLPLVDSRGVNCQEYLVCTGGQAFVASCQDLNSGALPFFDAVLRACVAQREVTNIFCPLV